jgi:hypothetical protein
MSIKQLQPFNLDQTKNYTFNGVSIANVANLTIPGGTSGQVLSTDGSGHLSWVTQSGGSSGGTPGGANTQIQFNDAGAFGGSAGLTFDKTSNAMTVAGNAVVGNDLYVGAGANATGLSNPTIIAKDSGATYIQIGVVNSSNSGSADFCAYGDNGNDTQGWADMGFTGSNFSDANYTITGKNDGYVFANAVTGTGLGGNLVFATGSGGTTKDIVFATGGFLAANEKIRFQHSLGTFNVKTTTAATSTTTGAIVTAGGLGVAGNIYGNVFYGNGAGLTNIPVGNISGLGNVALLNKDGNASNILYGNGVFAAAPAGGSGGGATLSAVAAATTYYVGLSANTSGSWSDARVDTTNLYYSSGTQTLFATNYNTSSDANVKTNVHTIENALDIVNLLRGVGFDWLETGLKSYGVIAQELEKHIPELVTTINGKKTVNYNAIIGFLIEAIKTQSNSMKTLEDRIAALENKDGIST